jgi:hypothetical protein
VCVCVIVNCKVEPSAVSKSPINPSINPKPHQVTGRLAVNFFKQHTEYYFKLNRQGLCRASQSNGQHSSFIFGRSSVQTEACSCIQSLQASARVTPHISFSLLSATYCVMESR